MSWSAFMKREVPKGEIQDAIANITTDTPLDGPMLDQLQAAKRAALELVKSIPGPYLQVVMNGHANGVGWQQKEGWANDTISVTVTQRTE